MNKIETAVFGGGCFWCTEAVFRRLRGVASVTSGYSGGDVVNPTYEQVSAGTTGHAEAVQIKYDPEQIKYEDLLNVFFAMHDPTTLNKQGNDIGTQYRSVIFYTTDLQKQLAQNFINNLTEDQVFEDPIVTQIESLKEFYVAEDYHQNYFDLNQTKPYCQVVINPKVAKLRQKFTMLLKSE